MQFAVLLEVTGELEPVTTYFARERPLIRVNGLMSLSRMTGNKRLAALAAYEVTLVSVPLQVVGQLGLLTVDLVTMCALVRADSEVH